MNKKVLFINRLVEVGQCLYPDHNFAFSARFIFATIQKVFLRGIKKKLYERLQN